MPPQTAQTLEPTLPPEAGAALLAWFAVYKRDLPWRRTRDPYAIWVSEIMLQQTRVAAVLEHYARWMDRFPTVAALAAATEPEVLARWSGLGYYRRARMLHRAAQVVVAEHGGVLPATAEGLRALPGIGAYTAAAIASIAFGEAVAVVDGNVERIALRLAGPILTAGEGAGTTAGTAASIARGVRGLAQSMVDAQRAGDSNQAMMELGATVCLPRGPLCLQCPVQPWCRTRGEHRTMPRKALVDRAVAYGLATRGVLDGSRDGVEVRLVRRAVDAPLMAGMWELPECEESPGAPARDSAGTLPLLQVRHAITVTNYRVSVWRLHAEAGGESDGQWFAVEALPELALTGLARKVLQRLQLWPQAS
jgi:A/G-specific adenine glycosylase